jgi:DNA-binding MarR family transcriptional regulator
MGMTGNDRARVEAIDRFWETVPPLWSLIRTRIRAAAAADFEITVEQFHVLRYVRRGRESVSELATAKNISRPAISQAVEVLVQKGLIHRAQSAQDRRFVALTLTKEGDALLDAVFSKTRLWMKERMAGLTVEELQTITHAMTALRKMLD